METDKESENAKKIVKILCISCSPRQKRQKKDGSRSEKMLEKLAVYVRGFGGEAEIIALSRKKIRPCEGCYSYQEEACVFPCVHKDDTNEVLFKIIEADALVFSTPIYWGAPSSLLRILIEKMTAIENNRQNLLEQKGVEPLEGKPFVLLASQDSEGASLALSQTAWALNHMGLLLLPNGLIFEPALLDRPIARMGLRLMGVRKFEWIENSIRLAARNLVLFPEKIRDYRFDDYLVIEPRT